MSYDDEQRRGDRGAYERYLAGMDASMQQKVALTAAHLLCEGRVADMGMGSGAGSYALAALYPSLEVVGVDMSPQMVALAWERHRAPNLSFREGDIAARVFEDGELDAILDSSVLHHVTSFSGYDRGAAARALAVQVDALREGGVLVVRDFLDPGEGEVLLDVRADDGDDSDDPRTCSTAALLLRFSKELRSLSDAPGFPVREVSGASEGFRRFRLAHTHAVELVLRKDYREDWELEAKEEYTYATQRDFEQTFARLGLRVLASIPLRNPWIVKHRFRGQIALYDVEGASLEVPATNYVIVGEKVPPGSGVRFRLGEEQEPVGFLRLTHHRDRRSMEVIDLVARPNLTLDAIPWFEQPSGVFVLTRMSYPRPVLRAAPPALDGASAPHYMTEPLAVIQGDKPVGQTVEEALFERAGIAPSQLQELVPGATYYPSAGGLCEEVRSLWVRVEPVLVQREVPSSSGFSSSGRVAAVEARQLLRAAQVGGLPDARLELNVYGLLTHLGQSVGPWIGAEVPATAPTTRARLRTTSVDALLKARPRRCFEAVDGAASTGFLEVRCRRFDEVDAEGRVLTSRTFEYVEPRTRSARTVSVALLWRHGERVYLGVEDDDRPAAQCITGHSNLLTVPAWRLPMDVDGMDAAERFLREQSLVTFGVELGELAVLGGRYHPSAGATPEVVHPFAAEVRAARECPLLWVDLQELLGAPSLLRDGHLRIAAFRAAHALGLLS